MQRFGYWKAIVMSFYSRELYRDVAENWGLGILLYLLLVLAICLIPIAGMVQKSLNTAVPRFTAEYGPQVPLMDIQNGVVKTPENRPYLIKSLNNNEVLAIVDTSGKYTSLDNNSADFLLTKDTAFSRNEDGAIKMQKLSPKVTIQINPTEIKHFLDKWVRWVWIVIFPLILLAVYLFRLIQVLIYAVIGKVFSLIMEIELTYGQILKLAMVGLTPVIVLRAIFDVVGFEFYRQGLFYFVVAIAYLVYAIKSNDKEI